MKVFSDKLFPIIPVALVLIPMFFSHSCANTSQAPTGGLKDTIPPVIVHAEPAPGTCNIPRTGQKFIFTFNENVTVKTPANILFSPPLKKMPKSKTSGKNLIVYFERDTLAPNTTYTIDFTNAVADNNEGNMFPGYTYAFSTGDKVDSMMVTGLVQDCSTLAPLKDATVLLYKDLSDSAVFLKKPDAVIKTDDWGFFCLRNIQDTMYRMYAIVDENNDNIYNPESESVAFLDSVIRPVIVVDDSLPEAIKYDMKDTLKCQARKAQYELNMFKERNARQAINNKVRVNDRTSYITFLAPNAHIDTMWVAGVSADRLITQFNPVRDSLEIWVNDRRQMPDTFHVFVNYLKTDTLNNLTPYLEEVKLVNPNPKSKRRASRQQIRHEDTICVYKLEAKGETLEKDGYTLSFDVPIINEGFDSMALRIVNPKQQEEAGTFKVAQDSVDLKKYKIMPQVEFLPGYEYFLKIKANTFQDIDGFWNDSTEVKVSLPNDEKMCTLSINLKGVDNKYIVDILNEMKSEVLRSEIVTADSLLVFKYLQAGKYCIRITEDLNNNSLVDTGDLLAHKQPEKVKFFKLEDDDEFIEMIEMSEIEQEIDITAMFK